MIAPAQKCAYNGGAKESKAAAQGEAAAGMGGKGHEH